MSPLLLALAFAAGPTEVVYDNTTTYLHSGMPLLTDLWKDGAEMGDEVHLAGAARRVTELRVRFWYNGTTEGHFDARVRLRPLDESVQTPGPAILEDGKIVGYRNTASPGKPLYQSGLIKRLKAEPGMNEYVFKIPRVTVPDRVVWTVQGYNATGTQGNIGPAYYDPPTVGSSEDWFWQSDRGSKWTAYSWGFQPVANFGARITAEP